MNIYNKKIKKFLSILKILHFNEIHQSYTTY